MQTSLYSVIYSEVRTRKASQTSTIRPPAFIRMKECHLGMHTNAWNALRYFVITLAVVPLAEYLWSRLHSRRTGARVIQGRTACLRRSRLAHWGLHQEVDEESRLRRVFAILVCMLHIAGALLVEYGSGSVQTYSWKDATVSSFLREHRGLRPNGVYFLEAGFILGKPDGIATYIAVGIRNLEDFGLRVLKISAFRLVPITQFPKPSNADFKMRYSIPNSGKIMEMYDNGTARWFGYFQSISEGLVHSTTPSICTKEIDDGNMVAIVHTFRA